MTALELSGAGLATASHAPRPDAERSYFFLTSAADSGLLARVLNIFIKLNLTPYRMHVTTEHGAGEEMTIELRFSGMTPQIAEGLAARCRTIIGIRSVITASDG
jgi:hypothetical protein